MWLKAVCVIVSLPIWALSQFMQMCVCEQISVQHYFKYHQGVQAKYDRVSVSDDNDKAGLLVTNHGSSKVVQP